MAKQKILKGKAPLTVCRTNTGSYEQVYCGQIVPASITAADRTRLLKEGYLTEEEVDVAAGDDTPAPGTADAGLAEVGEDPAKAKAALAEEQKRDKPRSTLVAKLEAIAATGD